MSIERITITFNKDETFRGASAEGWDNMPVPLDPKALAGFADKINLESATELARIKEIHQQELEALNQKHQELISSTDEASKLLIIEKDNIISGLQSEIKTTSEEKDNIISELKGELTSTQASLNEKIQLEANTIQGVIGLLERKDPDEMIEFAKQFTTPVEEKVRQEKLQQYNQLAKDLGL